MSKFKKYLAILLFVLSSGLAFSADKININTATAEQIAEGVKGVGPKKAEEILKYRKANGKFNSVDDLVNVKGIGEATVNKNRDILTVK